MKPAPPREAEGPGCQGNGLPCTLRELGTLWPGLGQLRGSVRFRESKDKRGWGEER